MPKKRKKNSSTTTYVHLCDKIYISSLFILYAMQSYAKSLHSKSTEINVVVFSGIRHDSIPRLELEPHHHFSIKQDIFLKKYKKLTLIMPQHSSMTLSFHSCLFKCQPDLKSVHGSEQERLSCHVVGVIRTGPLQFFKNLPC